MGMHISACIIVGLHRNEIPNADHIIDNELLEVVAPYYDGGDDFTVGVVVARTGCYTVNNLPTDLASQIEAAKIKFKEVTGLDADVLLSPNVS